jgi:murein DD-endopeptidase MepM/ murein hydrolase activator NlpD
MLLACGLPLFIAAPVAAHTNAPRDSNRGTTATELIRCPLTVDGQFTDSWGDARSNGRRHEGVDVVAPRGTPIVAVRSGVAEFKRSRLAGNAIWLTTTDGNRYFYAHLDAWEGESRAVRSGEVIGYVGSTGNARSDHLHFETHPDGRPVNPYPAVTRACAAMRAETSLAPGPYGRPQ